MKKKTIKESIASVEEKIFEAERDGNKKLSNSLRNILRRLKSLDKASKIKT